MVRFAGPRRHGPLLSTVEPLAMNVHLYASVVVVLGLVLSFFGGRLIARSDTFTRAIISSVGSFALGIFLTLPFLQVIAQVCALLSGPSVSCIKTDDTNVWALSYPLVAFPLYFLVMLFSRKSSEG
jgi:hypothetical protein